MTVVDLSPADAPAESPEVCDNCHCRLEGCEGGVCRGYATD